MTDKPAVPDDPKQFQRFLDMEKQLGAEYDEADFDAKIKKITRYKYRQNEPDIQE